jgi:hypothetical protein
VKREGIDLSAGFTATVNADLRVGGLEETITVSGQAPDQVQRAAQLLMDDSNIVRPEPACPTVLRDRRFSSSAVDHTRAGGLMNHEEHW